MPNATLNSFSEFTQGKASQIRNCANEHEMRAWFEALFLEKFDGQDARAQKAWAWCSTVGRKHMLREGASEPFRPRRDVLASWPRWIRDAIKAGKPLSALSLAPSERDFFINPRLDEVAVRPILDFGLVENFRPTGESCRARLDRCHGQGRRKKGLGGRGRCGD